MADGQGDGVRQTLYQCPRCTVQWSGPDADELRLCDCSSPALADDKKLQPVGTVEADERAWTRLGPAAETLQKGFGVRYENEYRLKLESTGVFQDFDTDDDPVPGQILGIEETRWGPRYEVSPETEWWHPERPVDDDAPVDTVWHWEIVEVTERTRASVRLEEIRRSVEGGAGD